MFSSIRRPTAHSSTNLRAIGTARNTLSMIRNDEQPANRREQDHVESGCGFVHEEVRSDPRLTFGGVRAGTAARERKPRSLAPQSLLARRTPNILINGNFDHQAG
jgi:hypothetical protein